MADVLDRLLRLARYDSADAEWPPPGEWHRVLGLEGVAAMEAVRRALCDAEGGAALWQRTVGLDGSAREARWHECVACGDLHLCGRPAPSPHEKENGQ